MSGMLTNGLPALPCLAGNETFYADTNNTQGENPETGRYGALRLSLLTDSLSVTVDKTGVSGTRYYTNIAIGTRMQFTGVGVKIGSVGGTDKFIAELHDSTGALVASSNTSGVTVGTANTWQYLPFQSPSGTNNPYMAAAGTYYIAIQLNGTTARLAVLDNPNLGSADVVSGSATGSFGTGAAITPPTTYTVDLAPAVVLYQ